MSDTAFVINGTRRTFQADDFDVQMSATARSSMLCKVYIPGATWRPTVGEEIAIWTSANTIGSARSFNGSTSVASRSYSDTTINNFTLGVWVRASSAANNQVPFHLGTGAKGYGFITFNTGYWGLHYQGVGIIGGTSAPITVGSWHLLVGRRSSGTSQLFLDGSPVGSTSSATPAAPDGSSLWVVGARAASDLPFSGDVAWAFFTNSVLTDAQIGQMAAGGPAGTAISPDQFDTGGLFRTYPLRGDATENDTDGSNALTLTDVTTVTDGPLVISADADVVFAGDIETTRERGVKDKPVDDIVVDISASDFNGRPDRIYQVYAVDAGTLEDQLNQIITTQGYGALMGGVTLASDQPTGPSVEAIEAANVRFTDTFNRLTESTGYVWRIDEFKVLSFRDPSSVSAPFDITEASKLAIDDVTVETSLADGFANWVWINVGAGTKEITSTLVGNGVNDEYALPYSLVSIPRGYVVEEGLIKTVSYDPDTSGNWVYDRTVNTLRRSAGVFTNGHEVEVLYLAQFPYVGAVAGPDTSEYNGLIQYFEHLENEFDVTVAEAYADTVLASRNVIRNLVTYQTRQPGLRPGQIQNINLPDRNINTNCVITEVNVRAEGPYRFRYTVTASTDGVPVSWREALRAA